MIQKATFLARTSGLPGRKACGVAFFLLAALIIQAVDSTTTLEFKVKAGYLFNFTKYVEWPTDAFPSNDSPFVIGVLDGSEAQPAIEKVLVGKTVKGHPVEVKTVFKTNLPKDLHMLLVTRGADKTPEEIRAMLGMTPTLLVGETDQFAERGGAIAIVRQEESFRLSLCLEHATENGLKVSAKLSNVAKSVKSKRRTSKDPL